MLEERVAISTLDGTSRAQVFTPAEPGPHPGVILYPDALGPRPAVDEMGRRLAGDGYVVLVPDLFYRAGDYGPIDGRELFASGRMREVAGPLMASTDNRRAAQDSAAYLDHLATRSDVSGDRVGLTGYCMGGSVALTVAGTYPDRVAAVASFHAGRIATDADTSPHRVMPAITGRVYIAGADEDQSYPPEMADRVDAILTEAGVERRVSSTGWRSIPAPGTASR